MRLVGVPVGVCNSGIIARTELHHPQSPLEPGYASVFLRIHADIFAEQATVLFLAQTGDSGEVRVEAVEDIDRAVRLALAEAGVEDVILAFGSLSYLGRVMEIVKEKGWK